MGPLAGDPQTFDLAFIGGGISCSFTWQALLPSIAGQRLRFVMLDRDGSLGTGVPYGTYAQPAYLLNDVVSWNDTPTGELGWLPWLKAEKQRWLPQLAASDDPAIIQWLTRYRGALDRDQLEHVFMPRYVFGQFLRERFERHLGKVTQQGHQFTLLSAEVTDIERGSDGAFSIAHSGSTPRIRARNILLGIGLPVSNRWPQLNDAPGYISIHDVHTKDLAARVRSARPGSGNLDVGILGGGPSAVEMAYRWLTHPELTSRLRKLVIVTTSGNVPQVGTETTSESVFNPRHMAALMARETIDAGQVFNALRDDVLQVRATGFPWLCALPVLHAHQTSLLKLLSVAEKRRYLLQFSNQLGSILKSSSIDYEQMLRAHEGSGVVLRAGHVDSVNRSNDRFEIVSSDRSGSGSTDLVDIVINCLGTRDLRNTEYPLLSKILERGLVRINEVGRGLQVDENFVASPGIFVLGPLLAGTANRKFVMMRLENIVKIFGYSGQVAAAIAQSLTQPMSTEGRG
jgi:uncharacterized NAD(P)/FAD-binding protein YdhS